MSQKIQVKFYPLTSDITTMLRKGKLTAAEWRIWSYLIEVDPWGDRYRDLDSLDVISKCDCSRATFYRAIAKFQKLGLFDIQDKGFSIRNLTGASTLKSDDGKTESNRSRKSSLKNETISVSKIRLNSQNCESNLKNEIGVSKMRLDSQICDNQSPETPSDKAFKSPQTLQTYSDFKKTLSKNERENFLKFVREQIHNLERPINDLEAWLASKNAADQNRWEIYYKNYQAQKFEQKPRNTQKTSRSGNSTHEKNSAIAEFRKRMSLNRSANEPEPETPSEEFNSNESELENELEDSNSAESTQRNPEFDELIANPPQQTTKSLAELEREEAIAARRKQWEWKRKIKEAAEARAKQVNPDPEQRKAEMLRQVEAYKQFLQQQNEDTPPESNSKTRDARSETDLDENKEITGENDENE